MNWFDRNVLRRKEIPVEDVRDLDTLRKLDTHLAKLQGKTVTPDQEPVSDLTFTAEIEVYEYDFQTWAYKVTVRSSDGRARHESGPPYKASYNSTYYWRESDAREAAEKRAAAMAKMLRVQSNPVVKKYVKEL